MVATRSARTKAVAPEAEPAAPAKKTLKAPPKRAAKKAPVDSEAEPSKAKTASTKTKPAPRAKPEPKVIQEPEVEEAVPAKSRAKAAKAKPAPKAKPEPEPVLEVAAPVKSKTRASKAKPAPKAQPEEEAVPEPEPEEVAPIKSKTKAARAKPAAKTNPEPEVIPEPASEEAAPARPKARAARAKSAPKTKPEPEVVPEPAPEEVAPAKPKARATKAKPAPEPKKEAATTKRATRATRSTVEDVPPESPLKKPAKRPAPTKTSINRAPRKATKSTKLAVPAQQDPFDEFPNWPTTPAHIRLPRPVEENPLREFPNYPNTPAHIKVPILVEENPLREFPNYPNTPAHIKVPTLVEGNPLRDFPNYPNTPAHITAPTPVEENPLREFPNYPNTPAHITAPTPVEENPLREFPNYPNTPAHIQMPTLVEFAEDPIAASTPTQYTEDVSMEDVMDEPIGESVCLPPPVQHASVAMLVPEAKQVVFAPSVLPILAPAALGSPIKSAMRSPQKESPQKKSVTFNAHPYSAFDSSLLITDGPLSGTIFYVDVQSNGKAQNHLFVGLLEDLGAQVIANWNSDYIGLTHVLFKDGSPATLQKVKATNGAVKCVNIGWAIDCEKNNKRMDEADYAVNLNQAPVPISTPAPKRIAWTPARTPSQFFNFQTPSSVPATPPTPNSSEWERSLTIDDLNDKENKDPSPISKPIQQTCPAKPQSLVASILRQSPIKFSLAPKTVARPMKRKLETFGGISMAPPKKPRFL